ncbi:MAG: hypothetical protein ACXVH3_32360 [Solirubrobacteraceae bacterium]
MDDETLAALREIAGREAGLPPSVHGRISGDSIGALRSDASRLAKELGLEARSRDDQGRFTGSAA